MLKRELPSLENISFSLAMTALEDVIANLDVLYRGELACRRQGRFKMKVYESSHPTNRDYTRVPQIKIKNQKLSEYGFKIGAEFKIIYSKNYGSKPWN